MMKRFFGLFLAALFVVCAFAFTTSAAESALPNASVADLGKVSVGAIGSGADYEVKSYYVYDLLGNQQNKLTTSSDYFEMQVAMEFVAIDTPTEAKKNVYGNYTTDFFVTINGVENGSFVADGCFLAGYYESYGAWVKIPLDGFTVENGKAYPVITSAGHDFSYVEICKDVEAFKCGIYFTPEVLAANPNMTATLELGLAENIDKALSADFVTVDEYTYEVEDLIITTIPNASVADLGKVSVGAIGSGADYEVKSYYVYDLLGNQQNKLTTSSDYFEMQVAMEFVAIDTPTEAKKNVYGNYTTDFFVTINGVENGSFVADGCFLAGYYESYGAWVKIPLDGFTVENGKAYPVITSAGHDFSYVEICKDVEAFKCGIYFTPEVLAANPNMTATLELGLAENIDKALSADFVTVDEYTYDVEDLLEEEIVKFNLYGVNMTLESSLDMTFFVNPADLEEGETYTAVITKKYADREDKVVEIPSGEWGTLYGYKTVTFSGIAAKEMTDAISIEIYNSDNVAVSNPITTSVEAYALGYLGITTDPEFRTLLVDMLVYGAAAQIQFEYNIDDLATADLTAAQMEYASANTAEWEVVTTYDANYLYADTLYLEDTIALALHFHNVGNATYATVTYTDHYNNGATSYDVELGDYYTLKEVKIDTLAVADATTVVTCELKDASGNVVTTVTDSISSCVARALKSDAIKADADLYAVYESINMFAASAYAYFH